MSLRGAKRRSPAIGGTSLPAVPRNDPGGVLRQIPKGRGSGERAPYYQEQLLIELDQDTEIQKIIQSIFQRPMIIHS